MENIFSGKAWKLERDGDLLVASFDLQGERVNKLSHLSIGELNQVIDLAASSNAKGLLIRSLKKNSFIVGADIHLIQSLSNIAEARTASSEGQTVFDKLEDLKIPTLVAIDGPCMGGGTELSLSCKHRICSDSEKTVIGLPEVKLGLLPGWGGTYRLPRLVGLPFALEMILEGKSIRADKAEKTKLVDAVVPAALFQEKALEAAHSLIRGKGIPASRPRKEDLSSKLLNSILGRIVVFKKAKEGVMKATRGHYPAPLKILDVLQETVGTSRKSALEIEATAFSHLWATAESKNLVNLFFLMEEAKKNTGSQLTEEAVKKLAPIKQLGVLGAGVMGGGIAAQSATFGIYTLVKDVNLEAVAKAFAHARELFDKQVKRRRLKPRERDDRMGKIRGQVDFTGFGSLDLLIEAIVENVDIKRKVLAEVETYVRPDCVIASNTSSLRLSAMASSMKDPSRFVGIHFFNPVDKMPLIEVIRHETTSEEAVAKAVAYSKAIGKTPVVVKDGPGFLVNRLLMPWLNESAFMLEEGFPIELLDKTAKNFGMPMGPCELLDEIGIDVGAKVSHILNDAFGDRAKASAVSDKVIAATKDSKVPRYGRKTGSGFYEWDRPGGKRGEPDSMAINQILFGNSAPQIPEHTESSIQWRMFYPMINEAARALEEGIVDSPAMCDLAMIFGTGFPPFKGGLLRYADSVGLDKIVAELERLSLTMGERMKPSEALKKFAARGSFYTK
jgi:3-hydroxyacyl-CoA dehydrogenase/enoyl-CoA hydratase/3-hydroxybutyryl-CoA epimerase